MADITIPSSSRDEFQALLDKSYKSYSDDLEAFIEAACEEMEQAVGRGGMDVQGIVREYAQAAAKLADDYYQRTRSLWSQYGNTTLPPLARYGLVDTERALWNMQHKLINERYIGLRYRDALNGHTKYGVTIQDLWPSMENIDDAQQFIADMMRTMARLQTQQDVRLDPTGVRWARVPQGSVTCAFCMMLASRGFAYTSEETAGGLDNYFHADCDCKIVPTWGEATLEGYDLAQMRQWWRDAKGAAGTDQSYQSVLKAMRRMHPDRYTDGVAPNPEAPWSGAARPPSPEELARLSDFSRRMPGDKYTAEQKQDALRSWTGGTYAGVNRFLFQREGGSEYLSSLIDRIDESMNDHPTYEAFTVDRQMMLQTFHLDSIDQIGELEEHDIFDHAGYAACSTLPGGIKIDEGRIATRIFVPPGSHGVYLKPISLHKKENEVLIARDARFEFIGTDLLDNGEPILCLRLL